MVDRQQLNYQRHKWSTYISMYIGYTLIVLNRKSFSFILPAVIKEGRLDKDDLGLIASSQNVGYTISKLIGGVMSDSVNSRVFFSAGLLLSGIVTIIFTGFESASVFAFLWFLQGIFQGGTWPACAKILRQWFSPSEFGTWYAFLNTPSNVACCSGPILAAYILSQYDNQWSICLQGLGTLAVAVSMGCFLFITNSPEEAGLVSEVRKEDEKGRGKGRGRGTWQDMIQSPFMVVLFVSYFIVFMARTAALDWGQLLLIEERGQSQYVGSAFISSLELGGTIGSIVAGYGADKLVAISKREDTKGTPRMTVVMAFITLTILSLHCFIFLVSENTPQVLIMLIAFMLGFGIYGPVALYGVMAIESAPTHLSGTSHAIVALSANLGAVFAGLPLSYVATYFDWKGAFIFLEIALIAVLIMKVKMRNTDYKMVPVRKKLQ